MAMLETHTNSRRNVDGTKQMLSGQDMTAIPGKEQKTLFQF